MMNHDDLCFRLRHGSAFPALAGLMNEAANAIEKQDKLLRNVAKKLHADGYCTDADCDDYNHDCVACIAEYLGDVSDA